MPKDSVHKVLTILGMNCASCVLTIEKELEKLRGVKEARVNYLLGRVVVDYDPMEVGLPAIEKRIEDLGYRLAYKRYGGILDRIKKLFKERDDALLGEMEDHDFQDLVIRSDKPVVLLLTHPNCPTCEALKPRVKEVAEKLREKAYFYQMDTEKTTKWKEYNVQGTPTILYFKGGMEVGGQGPFPESFEIEEKVREIVET